MNSSFRSACAGILPLAARLEPWMIDAFSGAKLHDRIARFGSPLNLLCTDPMQRNICRLMDVANARSLDFQIFFARKANKCVRFIDAASAVGAGIDTASEVEVRQTLGRGVSASRMICTAAIKGSDLMNVCIVNGVTVAIDNADEWRSLQSIASARNRSADVAIRASGFAIDGNKLPSRFGIDIDDLVAFIQSRCQSGGQNRLNITGLQFHLDGYCGKQRVAAIEQLLPIVDALRAQGHRIEFLDMGGGFPMCYLESPGQWQDFWTQHELALLGQRGEITYQNHGLGKIAVDGRVYGSANVYPWIQVDRHTNTLQQKNPLSCPGYLSEGHGGLNAETTSSTQTQPSVAADWFAQILDAPVGDASVAGALRARKLQLRCEPGRSLLDGCGITVARVEFNKPHRDGYRLIGLSMNRTQCRTTHDEFMVDPVHVSAPRQQAFPDDAEQEIPMNANPDRSPDRKNIVQSQVEGYLVGAYCTESELLSWRRFRFAPGIAAGDLIVFPNTAGYLMHFMESRSHQFPLARNVFLKSTANHCKSITSPIP